MLESHKNIKYKKISTKKGINAALVLNLRSPSRKKQWKIFQYLLWSPFWGIVKVVSSGSSK